MREVFSNRDEACYIVNSLMTSFKRLPSEEIMSQWDYLSAAHIVGQTNFLLHSKVHLAMLQLALHQRNWSEIFGQMFRLSLVPLGHLFQRLPLGNSGRSNVNAFKTMSIEPKIARLIESGNHTSSKQP